MDFGARDPVRSNSCHNTDRFCLFGGFERGTGDLIGRSRGWKKRRGVQIRRRETDVKKKELAALMSAQKKCFQGTKRNA